MLLILKSPAAHPSSPCAFCAPGDAAGPDDTVRMELPKLSPGKRFTLPRPLGSADSLLLARLAERDRAAGRTTAIVTADATDAQRLIDEMAFLHPPCGARCFPTGKPCPTTPSRRTRI